METLNIFWTASLSNGQTIYENKGDYAIKAGDLSPWRRLLLFLQENPEVKITSISLYTNDNRRFNLPSAGRNPKFKAFADAEQPISYNFFRKAGIDFDTAGMQEGTEIFSVIEAIYPANLHYDREGIKKLGIKNKRLQLWVSGDGRNCWSVIIK